MTLAIFGVSFLTPLAGLFALLAALPLGALWLLERRAREVRRVLRVPGPGRRPLVPVCLALVLLPALVAVAAAQPVVVRRQLVSERADAQAIVLFDTSKSMLAGRPARLARAKRLALQLQRSLPDLPMGVATMTDRSLLNLMPTTDRTLFERTVAQSIAVDRPPPSEQYGAGRATTFDALIPLVESRFFSQGVRRRLVVVYTDGESRRISPVLRLTLKLRVKPIFVHVWRPDDRIAGDSRYAADPGSRTAIATVASETGGAAYAERDAGGVAKAARDAVGRSGTRTRIDAYARVPLAPWFVLAGAAPLGFLLWRRNG